MSPERKGELWILLEVILFAFFPLMVNYATKVIPPLFFAGVCTLLAALVALTWLLSTGNLHHLAKKHVMPYLIGAALFIAFFPQIFIFIGASKTSSINVSILWQTEILFTFLICSLLYHEKVTLRKAIGALIVAAGATVVMWRGNFQFNPGDLFIVIGTAFFPFGNICTKEALKHVPGTVVLFVRSALGGALLLGLSMIVEKPAPEAMEYFREFWWLFLLTGIGIMGISKLIWYKGLRFLEIGKAISISLSTPAFTLLYIYFIFKTTPTFSQWMGLLLVGVGLWLITRRITEKNLPELQNL